MANLNNKSLEELFKIESEEMESDFEQDSSSSEAESDENLPKNKSNSDMDSFANKNLPNVEVPIMKLTCDNCAKISKKTYFSKLHLAVHKMIVHTKLQKFKKVPCGNDFCKEMFNQPSKYLDHVTKFHLVECMECPRSFCTIGGMQNHFKTAHLKEIKTKHIEKKLEVSEEIDSLASNRNSAFKIVSDKLIKTVLDAIAKQEPSGTKDSFKCFYCRSSTTYGSRDELALHVKLDHPIPCLYCPTKMFKFPTSVRKHFKQFHALVNVYFCKICTEYFTDLLKCDDHMKVAHGEKSKAAWVRTEIQPEIQPVTQSKIQPEIKPEIITAHQPAFKQRVQPEIEPPIQTIIKPTIKITCIICNETFENLGKLVSHRSDNHHYTCKFCEAENVKKTYKLTDSLRQHIRGAHRSPNIIMTCCKFCDEVFYEDVVKAKKDHMDEYHLGSESRIRRRSISDIMAEKQPAIQSAIQTEVKPVIRPEITPAFQSTFEKHSNEGSKDTIDENDEEM